MRKTGLAGLGAVALVVALVSAATAYSCPILIKEADELIAKAQAAVAKTSSADKPHAEQALTEAKKLVGEARKDHEGAKGKVGHADAVRKAKTAKAFAEEALVLAQP